MKDNYKIFSFWLLLLVGFILHSSYHLAELFFGINITLPDANGTVNPTVHIFRILVDISILTFSLLSLYIQKKSFYRFSFVWAVLLLLLNFVHFIETVTKEIQEISQLVILFFIFIVNLILVHKLHSLGSPLHLLPQKIRNLQWAKHQRRWFGEWHLYFGITAGFFLCVIGLTGSILVFQNEIDKFLNPALFEVQEQKNKIPLQEIIPIINEKYPDKKFNYVSVNDKDDPLSTYRFYDFGNKIEFFVNPFTAEISGKRIINSSFIRIVMNIHRTLLIPVVGRYIVGLLALSLIILSITGLRLWIPKNLQYLKAALTVKFSGKIKKINYDLHKVIGFFSAPVVIILALTGVVITFNTFFIALLFVTNGESPSDLEAIFNNKSKYESGFVKMSVNEAYNKIKPQFEDEQFVSISLPADSVGSYMFYFIGKNSAETGNTIMVTVDQYSGKILLNSDKDFPHTGKSFGNWTVPLHYGTFGGMPTRILAFLGGLVPLTLFITGFIIWLPRRKNQKNNVSFNKKNKVQKVKGNINFDELSAFKYMLHFFVKGLRYAGWFLIIGFFLGVFYGIISLVFLAPGVYVVLYLGLTVIINFVIALLVLLFQTIFLLPFGKTNRGIYKYFAFSLSFFTIFFPTIIVMSSTLNNVF